MEIVLKPGRYFTRLLVSCKVNPAIVAFWARDAIGGANSARHDRTRPGQVATKFQLVHAKFQLFRDV
jgi:hypothetical protein